jgi:hypothetical protein
MTELIARVIRLEDAVADVHRKLDAIISHLLIPLPPGDRVTNDWASLDTAAVCEPLDRSPSKRGDTGMPRRKSQLGDHATLCDVSARSSTPNVLERHSKSSHSIGISVHAPAGSQRARSNTQIASPRVGVAPPSPVHISHSQLALPACYS